MGERSAADSRFSSLALRRVNSESTGFRSASASIFQPNACNPATLMPTRSEMRSSTVNAVGAGAISHAVESRAYNASSRIIHLNWGRCQARA